MTDWTPDSKTIILVSNRSGQFGIYKQFLDSDMAEPLVTQGYGRDPRMSPDGKSVVYLECRKMDRWLTEFLNQ